MSGLSWLRRPQRQARTRQLGSDVARLALGDVWLRVDICARYGL